MRQTVQVLPVTHYPTFLSQLPLFAGLTEPALATLATHLRPRRYARQAIIFHADDLAHGLFLLTAGTVKLTLETPEGRALRLGTLSAPACFGEMTVLEGGPQGMQATALAPCAVLLLERAALLPVLEHTPAVAQALATQLSQHMRAAQTLVARLAWRDAPSRVAEVVLMAARAPRCASGPGAVQAGALALRDLPELTGLARGTIHRVLRTFAEAGMLRVVGGQVQMLDAGRLAHVQDGHRRPHTSQAGQAA
jgi:CRP-like cAMP-binding protein